MSRIIGGLVLIINLDSLITRSLGLRDEMMSLHVSLSAKI